MLRWFLGEKLEGGRSKGELVSGEQMNCTKKRHKMKGEL